MAQRRGGVGGAILAVAAVALCCAVPALVVVGAGLLTAAGGLAARYWPVTVVGLLALVWGGVRLGRLIAARNRALGDRGGPDA
ncbi:MAG: hypothetical protein HY658_01480 [Actinobacteria bacterium]|nr:hypothetical protein [Actinomycetota bacterium]